MEATRTIAAGGADGRKGIALRGVTKRFGAVTALDGVDLDVVAGEVHALLGENGAGKTTLLSLLAGGNVPDGGAISVDGSTVTIGSPADALALGLGTVHQHLTLVPTLTVRENLLLGDEGGFLLRRKEEGGRMGGRDGKTERRRDGENEGAIRLDLPMDAVVGELPIGVRHRVEIAKALRRGWRALLLDEPTAVLAPAEVDELLGMVRRLADGGRAVVLVTHKLDEALAVCDRITVLRAGRVVLAEAVAGDRAGLRGRVVGAMFGLEEEGGRRKEEGDGMTERWKDGQIDVGAHGRAPVGGGQWGDASRGHGAVGHPVRVVLEVESVTARDGRGAVALDGVTLGVRAGEVLGIAGVEGNGQRELAEVLAGQRRVEVGSIRLDGEDVTGLGVAGRLEAGIAFLTDERLGEGVVPGASVALNLALKRLRRVPFSNGIRLDRRAVRHRGVGMIVEHDIRPASPDRDVATLSGGNIQKVMVTRELAGNPRVLVASKPTAGLDLRTAERVLGLLRGHARGGSAVMLISNELDELLAMSDRIAVMYRGQVVALFEPSASSGLDFDREAIGRAMVTGVPDLEVAR